MRQRNRLEGESEWSDVGAKTHRGGMGEEGWCLVALELPEPAESSAKEWREETD